VFSPRLLRTWISPENVNSRRETEKVRRNLIEPTAPPPHFASVGFDRRTAAQLLRTRAHAGQSGRRRVGPDGKIIRRVSAARVLCAEQAVCVVQTSRSCPGNYLRGAKQSSRTCHNVRVSGGVTNRSVFEPNSSQSETFEPRIMKSVPAVRPVPKCVVITLKKI